MQKKGRPLPLNPYCQLLIQNIDKFDIMGGDYITLKRWSANEGAYLKFCLESHIKDDGDVKAFVDHRLKAIGKLNFREVMLLKGDKCGRADLARSPVSIAYAIERGEFKDFELAKLTFELGVDAYTYMLEERQKLLDEVYTKLLAV